MNALNELTGVFKKFPGIGAKSARRMAFYLLKKDKRELEKLAKTITSLKDNLFKCKFCGNMSDENPCKICSDPLRDKKILCVVESVEALYSFEDANIYNGLYHVLDLKSSPFESQDVNSKAIDALLNHIKILNTEIELIIATNPVVESAITYYAIIDAVENSGLPVTKITRLASGLPVGGSVEYADKRTLHTALEMRTAAN